MRRRIVHILFGIGSGLAAQMIVRPHHMGDLWVTAVLSLAGASIGEAVAERYIAEDGLQEAGLALSAIGALVMLLGYGITVYG